MTLRRRRLLGLLAVATVGSAGCLGDDDGPEGEPASEATIGLQTASFDEAFVWIEAGGTVDFVHEAGQHTVTLFHEDNDVPHRAPDGVEAFDVEIESGQVQRTFDTEGVYTIFCRPHATNGMATAVVVEDVSEDEAGLADAQDELSDGMRSSIDAINAEIRSFFGLDNGDANDNGGGPGY